jgi:hypothetical protein
VKREMKKANKKLVLGVLVFTLCIPIFSQDFEVKGNVLVKYRGYIERANVTIPENLGITKIGDEAFAYSKIASVTIPASVSSIGEKVFINCNTLSTITVDKRNSSYSDSDGVLFDKNKTTLICYPAYKKGESYIIPSSVNSIGDFAFFGCKNLTGIIITAGVTSIGSDVFNLCNNLSNITVDGRNSAYCDSDGVLFNKNMTALVRFPPNRKETTYVIPVGVSSIEKHAFFICSSILGIGLHPGVSSIGEEAFFMCANLAVIYIPDTVSSIGEAAFAHCKSLNYIILLANITAIERGVFRGCESLTEIIIPDSVTSIGVLAFENCVNLTSITIPESVTSIGDYAFSGCKSLTDITLPEGISVIEYGVFQKCESLTNIIIPSSVTAIKRYAFSGCIGFTKITIPSNVSAIGSYSFSNCDNLKAVVLPRNHMRGMEVFPEGIKLIYDDEISKTSFLQKFSIGIRNTLTAIFKFFVGE